MKQGDGLHTCPGCGARLPLGAIVQDLTAPRGGSPPHPKQAPRLRAIDWYNGEQVCIKCRKPSVFAPHVLPVLTVPETFGDLLAKALPAAQADMKARKHAKKYEREITLPDGRRVPVLTTRLPEVMAFDPGEEMEFLVWKRSSPLGFDAKAPVIATDAAGSVRPMSSSPFLEFLEDEEEAALVRARVQSDELLAIKGFELLALRPIKKKTG